MPESFSNRLYQFLDAYPHPHKTELCRALTAKTSLSTSGFPYISQNSFTLFLKGVPHLFIYGSELLQWLALVEESLKHAHNFHENELASVRKAIFVLRNIVFSTAICSPSDHWILKHILSVHRKIGLTQAFQDGGFIDREELVEKWELDRRHLGWDLSFLHSRGYLRCRGSRYALEQSFQAADIYQQAEVLQDEFLSDLVEPVANVLHGNASDREQELVSQFYEYPPSDHIPKSWEADHFQVNIGYRLVPTILALHVLKMTVPCGTRHECS